MSSMGHLSTQASTTPVKPIRFAHVVLRSQNVPEMSAFYKGLLAAEANFETSDVCFLTFDEEHHRVAIVGIPGLGEKQPLTAGLDHIAFTFGSLRELMTLYQQRKLKGLLPVWSVNHGTTMSLYYKDPDGNKVEMQADCFKTTDECNDFMRSASFAENPYGVDFDPEEVIRKLDAGEDEADLMIRQEIGPRDPPPFMGM